MSYILQSWCGEKLIKNKNMQRAQKTLGSDSNGKIVSDIWKISTLLESESLLVGGIFDLINAVFRPERIF